MGNQISKKEFDETYEQRLKNSRSIFFDKQVISGKKPKKLRNEICFHKRKSNELERVFNEDTRQKVSSVQNYPYCCIGRITGSFAGEDYFGTGFLIHKNIVATCAHNIYDQTKNIQAQKLYFTPLLSQENEKGYKIINIHYHQKFKKDKIGTTKDFAILELQQDLSNICGYLGFNMREDNLDLNKILEICGYPGDKQDKTLWTADGKPSLIKQNVFHYQIPTEKGQSGSPIMIKIKGQYYVVGIHISGKESIQQNIGIRFTPQKFQLINSWLGQKKIFFQLEKKVLGIETIKNFLNKKEVMSISKINLKNCEIDSKCIKKLAEGNWDNLQSLNLPDNPFGNEGIIFFQSFRNIKELFIEKCGINHVGMKRLSKIEFNHLTQLSLSLNKIGDRGIKYLKNMTNLKLLWMKSCEITQKGFRELANGDLDLEELKIKENSINDEGLKEVNKFSSLETLNIVSTSITMASVETLLHLKLKLLKKLSLSKKQIDEEGFKTLKAQMEHLNIVYE